MLVIGIGNEWRHDDCAGLEVARRLREANVPGIEVEERTGEPVDLLDSWSGATRVTVVDAVSSGAAPGTVHRLDAAHPLPARLFRGSTHALGLADAVELARSIGRLPDRLIVYGVEGERFDAGTGLSAATEAAVERLAARLAASTP